MAIASTSPAPSRFRTRACCVPTQLTNAVRTSSDEVIVSTRPGRRPAESFHVFSDLTLRLGERVTIDTLGLVGRLSGSLRTVADDTGFNRGTGELQVEEGKYTAYGRKLDIERGTAAVQDGPLNDPIIDLRAVKTFPDITAGVNVRGTLRQPRLTFFSDPPVSQSQIVSLLIAGGSLDSVQNANDPAQRSSAARNNMLLQGSAMLFQQFGSKVGLDDVSVESGPQQRHFAGAGPIPVAAPVCQLRRQPGRIDQHHQGALHHRRSLGDQDRSRHQRRAPTWSTLSSASAPALSRCDGPAPAR